MSNCHSCGASVQDSYNFCPICNVELIKPETGTHNTNNANDSIIMGDQFTGTKADTIIINQYPQKNESFPKATEINTSENGKHCSRCKNFYPNEQLLNCIDVSCEKSMCFSCYQLWQVPSVPEWQYCQEHTEIMKADYERKSKKCSSCFKPLVYGLQYGDCQYSNCNNLMCMDCYNNWYVSDPRNTYRATEEAWNYCEQHTAESIINAQAKHQHRLNDLSLYCNQNWESWVREQRDLNVAKALDKNKENLNGFIGILILALLIYGANLYFGSGLDGIISTVYNVVCFWIPLIFIGFICIVSFLIESGELKKSVAIKRQQSDKIPHMKFDFKIDNTSEENHAVTDWDIENKKLIFKGSNLRYTGNGAWEHVTPQDSYRKDLSNYFYSNGDIEEIQ